MKGLPQRDLGMAGKKAGKPVVQKKKLQAVTPVFNVKPKKSEPDDMPGFPRGGKQPVKTPPNPFASPVSKRLKGVKI